jgi:AcrR family transcriptional regulator
LAVTKEELGAKFELGKEYEHFLKLDQEKRARILAVCYDEFLLRGYDAASTNAIVKMAGISKGLLFRYFGSKEGLYGFLIQDAAKSITSAVIPQIELTGDFFKDVISITKTKMQICAAFPTETSFLSMAYKDSLPEKLAKSMERFKGGSVANLKILAQDMDASILKEGVDKDTAVRIIVWVCEKFVDEMLEKDIEVENLQSLLADFDKCLEVLKIGLCK